jgi:hypothetical protein
MAFLVADTLGIIRDELSKINYFSTVEIGEPKSPPADQYASAYIWMDSVTTVQASLNGSIEVYLTTVRLMTGLFEEPIELIETQTAEAYSKASEALFANFSLDNKIRNIDAAGQYGASYGGTWGHLDLGGNLYRIVDITLPLIVDDSATFAP